jgi:hypothetical protein
MRYVIKRWNNGNPGQEQTKQRRDAAAILFEREVYGLVAALAGLDTIWGKRAVAEARNAWINDVDVLTVPVGPDHKVTFQRFT